MDTAGGRACRDRRSDEVSSSLSLHEHMAALEASGARLGDYAAEAGLEAPVPTCPEWTVRELVAHQAMVHRWATAHIRGDDPDQSPTQTQILESVTDLVPYYREGLAGVVAALGDAPPGLEAMTFLKDAPPPREFWARRQAHETTIHMVDVQAALLGACSTSGEAALEVSLATDGLDELLRGFFTRGKSKLYDGTPVVVVVAPNDVGRRWVLRVDERLSVDSGDDDAPDADARAHRFCCGALPRVAEPRRRDRRARQPRGPRPLARDPTHRLDLRVDFVSRATRTRRCRRSSWPVRRSREDRRART